MRPIAAAILSSATLALGCTATPRSVSGTHHVQGMTADGTGYYGVVTVSADGGSPEVEWRLNGIPDRRGTLSRHYTDSLVIDLGVPGRGNLTLSRVADRLEGRWSLSDGSDSGWEIWVAADTQLPLPVVVEEFEVANGNIRIGPGSNELFPRVDKGYRLEIPAGGVEGVAVFLDGFRPHADTLPPAAGSFESEALGAGLALLRVTTGDPLDFLFTDSAVASVASQVDSALVTNRLADLPRYFLGLSLGGTRVLRLAAHLSGQQDSASIPAAIAVVDAPLDMMRMHRSESKAIVDAVHPAAAGEGRWVRYRLEAALGGPPSVMPDRYQNYSPYSYGVAGGGRAVLLNGIPLRAYHEPDIDWWMRNRGKGYQQMNSPDMAGLVNELSLLGSDRAELITTISKRHGARFGATPHTWSIVDNAELVSWLKTSVEVSSP